MLAIHASNGNKMGYVLTIKDFGSNNIVIIVHGAVCNKDDHFYGSLSKYLSYNTLRFDLEGNGDSEGEFSIAKYAEETDNIHSAVLWCRSQNFHVLCILGHSKAADEVIMYSSIYGDVDYYIAIAGRFYMEKLSHFLEQCVEEIKKSGVAVVEKRGKKLMITGQGMEDKANVNMEKYCNEARGGFCIIHGNADTVIPLDDGFRIRDLLGEKCLMFVEVQGSDHFFEGFDKELGRAAEEFLKKISIKA
jgi:alpha/beta superfamily hydrolase